MIILKCRSRKGAWIEILTGDMTNKLPDCRSRKGAWIEIALGAVTGGIASSRSRKGAWIEIITSKEPFLRQAVAPVRERGLKWPYFACIYYTKRSLP